VPAKPLFSAGFILESQYVLLEDPDIQARVRSDPRTFLDALRPPVVFDEIQNTPNYLPMFVRLSTPVHAG
jgi:hypothetical protein